MERFKIYKYDELVNLVMEKIKLEEEKDTGILDKIIDKVDVLSFFY